MNSASPYLRQHAHNPVFWYPWGREALDRAKAENKPILLSIGYSTCYWCHVMEREVFENLSIASLMNKHFINIKVDREEYPELDDLYMTARQMLTQEGGWPNNVFLTPDLKPFYAGGTYAAGEMYGKPSFPRLLEWLHETWTNEEARVRASADKITEGMRAFLQHGPHPTPLPHAGEGSEREALAGEGIEKMPHRLFDMLRNFHDRKSGGFFQAPKFPHECYLNFLLAYWRATGEVYALDMVMHSLGKMAAGGIYDHVACGFHRYAVDKEWYVPHFEKMLYNQAMLARAYTDAAQVTGNDYLADIAKSILDFTAGPLTDGSGAFYAAIDAETDGVEGAYYAWTEEELKSILTDAETTFFTSFYALADIPAFPGHKHAEGKVIVARKPLDYAAREHNMPYVQLAAMSGQLMNKLLVERNKRKAPHLDDKIIVGWNGLMIDAFARAGEAFGEKKYIDAARKAANYLLEQAIDNNGELQRVIARGKAQIPATLEDYAYLAKGLLALHRAAPDSALLDAATSLMQRADELFSDKTAPGYFFTRESGDMLIRIKSGDDSTLPNANAVMAHNLIELAELAGDESPRAKAAALIGFFMNGNTRVLMEFSTMLAVGLRLKKPAAVKKMPEEEAAGDDAVTVSAALFPADAGPGDSCELLVALDIKEGWHINPGRVKQPHLIPTQIDVQGEGVVLVEVAYPEPIRRKDAMGGQMQVYEGLVTITARLRLADKGKKRPKLKLAVRYQPCHVTACHAVRDVALTL